MLTLNRIYDNKKPDTVIKLGNGYYYYNYDIKEEQIIETDEEGNSNEITRWSFIPVYIAGEPNSDDCIKAVIKQYISIEDELKLINQFYSYKLGITRDETVENDYIEYLKMIRGIKEGVKFSFNEL